jgi:hypothetical protein
MWKNGSCQVAAVGDDRSLGQTGGPAGVVDAPGMVDVEIGPVGEFVRLAGSLGE